MRRKAVSLVVYLFGTNLGEVSLVSLQGLREFNHNAVLSRLMRRQNIARMVRGVQIACLAISIIAIAVLLVTLLADILGRMSMSSELNLKVASLTKRGADGKLALNAAKPDWSVISERKPFGALGKVVVTAPAAPTPPPSPLMLSLIGTFITQGQEPYAIIEDKKKNEQEMFLIGDSIFNQATLKTIYLDRVEVERNGKLEVLRLDEIGGNGGAGIVSTGANDFVVEEAELDKGLENLPLLLTQARAVPYFKDGRSIGLRLFAIKTGSLYEKVGLKNGDILKNINGNSLGDISQALKLFEQLKQERSITLILERDKQDREFKYTIR
ncbi:MAG: type II secretion system protein N [Pseudomonadota bacterium]